jgi:hypothetical protein
MTVRSTAALLPGLYSERAAAIEDVHLATALYTVAHIVDALLDRLGWPGAHGRLLDPSAGDGSFILRALRRLDVCRPGEVERVQGWEIHPGAAHEARLRIAEYLQDQGWATNDARAAARRMIVNKDFLTDGPIEGEFRTIAGNPPYLRYQRLPEYFRDIYANCLPRYAQGDLLHAFLDWCVKILPQEGAIGLVCSDRFLFNSTAATLRREMGSRVGISYLARLDAASSFYRPKLRVSGSPPRVHPIEVILRPLATGVFPLTGEPISPDEELGHKEEVDSSTLSDIATVSLAPWLGPMGIFVVAGREAEILRRAGAELVDAVDTDDIEGETLKAATRFAIRTVAAGPPALRAVDRHLRDRRHLMPPRGRQRPYWLPPESIKLSLDRPSLLIPRIARELRAITLPAGVLPINHNLSIVSAREDVTLEDLRAVLLSAKSQAWIQRHAPRLDQGYRSITTKLLRRLPV